MMYVAKNYEHLKGLGDLSDKTLETHFGLYQGYVNNSNKLLEKLSQLRTENKETEPEYTELKRRLGWEMNGMRLHEYYFGNLRKGGTPLLLDAALAQKIKEDFGSFENWEKDFRATAAMRGIGWVILYADTQENKLVNFWINEHDTGHLAGAEPIVVMDVFEHAYILDYGTQKAGYIDAFMKNLCWETVMKRFDQAMSEPKRK